MGLNDVLQDRGRFEDDFDADDLDIGVWVPHYLPQWSSRAASAATYEVADSVLRLSIPSEQGLWCEGVHVEPIRVSGIQSGVHSGPVGSPVGQQPFLDRQLVTEAQGTHWGWTVSGGVVEVRARMSLSPRSMASVWMVGVEDEPERSGEICLFEVFGRSLDGATADVGCGVHPFRDSDLTDDFTAERRSIDVTDFHVYAVDWQSDGIDFSIDDSVVRTIDQSPAYPMQVMIAVFDFPSWPGPAEHVPRLEVDWIRGW
jgi:hypothetical protein